MRTKLILEADYPQKNKVVYSDKFETILAGKVYINRDALIGQHGEVPHEIWMSIQ